MNNLQFPSEYYTMNSLIQSIYFCAYICNQLYDYKSSVINYKSYGWILAVVFRNEETLEENYVVWFWK